VTVVLLHAFPLDERMWEPQLAVLGDQQVVVPNLYGLGGSSIDGWAERVLDEVEGELVVVGASLGGYVALAIPSAFADCWWPALARRPIRPTARRCATR
jgi:pimeloyl-ACP methyl ester carboxylesterase